MKDYFNNPERLHNLFTLKKGCTILCDIDGTIIQHENIPDYSTDIVLLDGALEKMDEWYRDNVYVILTTSRNPEDRELLVKALAKQNIKYDSLVMGLPPGPRYLINDKKPYSEITMAQSFEVKRDEGIKSIGHSFAAVSIKENTIEKTLPADANQTQLNKFAWQYQTLSDLGNTENVKAAIPKVYGFTPHKFSIEYLEKHKGINQFDTYQRSVILPYVFEYVNNMYSIENEIIDTEKQSRDWDEWFTNFIDAKIYAKKSDLEKYGLDTSVFEDMKEYLSKNYNTIRPSFFARYFHGDLTYENILFYNFDVKFIDFDNDYAWGPVELDLGKLTQSIVTKYESWDTPESAITDTQDEFDRVLYFYRGFVGENVIDKAYFYCIIHLIRMIPYQAQRDVNRCHIALNWVKELFNRLNNK